MYGEYINDYNLNKKNNDIININLLLYLLYNTKLDINISLDMYAKPRVGIY